MHIENQIKSAIADTLNALFNLSINAEEILLQKTKKEFKGDFNPILSTPDANNKINWY